MPRLFEPFSLRDVTLPNRVGVSPMCEYSSVEGMANDWHLVHLGSRAVGGAGLVSTEATAVEARGRISPADLGIWSDAHVEPLLRITRFLAGQGAVPAIQLAHAGRKASVVPPWDGGQAVPPGEGGWEPIAPSAIPFSPSSPRPREMGERELVEVREAFAASAGRALAAGFRWLELHFAHGYLVHEFLSPLSNRRHDNHGGSFENRTRFALGIVRAVRRVWPERLPLAVRLSCTDWVEGGWTLEESVELSRHLGREGVDLIDCSSGALVPGVKIPEGPGYQTTFSRRIRAEAEIATAAVGLLTDPAQTEMLVRNGDADLVLLGRAMLRDPYWARRAAGVLGPPEALRVPRQYLRAY